jgi:3-oxoacyl-[acyl-carrier protein] reductase
MVKENVSEEMKQGLLRMTPLNKMAEPSDLAGAYLYLASDLSKFTTGTIIQVDGGLVM